MRDPQRTAVAVVGGGPVGLLTALAIASRNVEVQVFDKDRRTVLHSYALALHPESLRILDELGLAGRLVGQGHPIRTVAFYAGGQRRAELDFSKLRGKFPFLLVLPQSRLEAALEEALHARRVRVHWNHRVQDFALGDEGVRLEVARLDQVTTGYPIARTEWVVTKTLQVEATYGVGADGYHSLVRRKLGIEIADVGPAQSFSVYELTAGGELPDEARVLLDEGGSGVYWPLGGGRCRFSFELPEDESQRLSEARLRELIGRRAPWFSAEPREVYWSTAVRFERRLAETFAAGQVYLAGDAVHLTGPLGAQSMNVGLREAAEVARRIGEAVRARAEAEHAQAYDASRREEWKRLLGLEGAPWVLPGADPWVADNREKILPAIPASGRDLEALLRQIGLTMGSDA